MPLDLGRRRGEQVRSNDAKGSFSVSWLSRGPDSSGEVWIGCERLILKLSKVLLAMEVKGPYMHANQRLIIIQKWCNTRDIQLTVSEYKRRDYRYVEGNSWEGAVVSLFAVSVSMK
jgi:hypothetical protein